MIFLFGWLSLRAPPWSASREAAAGVGAMRLGRHGLLLGATALLVVVMSHGVGLNSPQFTVPQRWGYPFWEVVRDMADQGLTRAQTGKALGYRSRRFEVLLRENPELDPFESPLVIATYIRDTGEGFREALERMAARHYTLAAASRAIGFSSTPGLIAAMKQRGINVKFKRFDVIAAYERRYATTLEEALKRMSKQGISRNAAARFIGLNSGSALKYQMQIRGINVSFSKTRQEKRTPSTAPHPWRQATEAAIKNQKDNCERIKRRNL